MNTPDATPVALDTWLRREAYTFFSGLSDPFYSVTVTVDVTALHTYTKRRGLSFYYALVWLCTQSINHTTAFRYAIRNGQPVLLAHREPSFTDLHPGAEQFHIVTMPAGDALEDFCRAARAKSRAQTEFLSAAAESDALIYFSCLPWVSLTALTNERDFDADDAIPRIAWGKYRREGERDVLGLALEVNHRPSTDCTSDGSFRICSSTSTRWPRQNNRMYQADVIFKPMMPTSSSAAKIRRPTVTGSLNKMMPTITEPSAPMPVQTA